MPTLPQHCLTPLIELLAFAGIYSIVGNPFDLWMITGPGMIGPKLRVERIDGEIIDMPPTGSVHASRVAQIGRRFERAAGDAAIV